MTGETIGRCRRRKGTSTELLQRKKEKSQPSLSFSNPPSFLSFPLLSRRDLKRAHRDRAAWLRRQEKEGDDDTLVREVASRLVDRLEDCSPRLSSRFRRVLLLGAEPAVLHSLTGSASLGSAVEEVTVVDSSKGKLDLLEERQQKEKEKKKEGAEASTTRSGGNPFFPSSSSSSSSSSPPRLHLIHADEETYDPPPSSFDVALSCGGLHWINDLPGLLSRVRRSLAADGVFLAAVPGGDTLHELRRALSRAEMEVCGGVSARVSPMIRMRDAGSLLGRAGFLVPGVDVDEIEMRYRSFEGAVAHLRGLGESNAVARRDQRPMRRGVEEAARREFARICSAEAEEGAEEAEAEGAEGRGRRGVFKSTFEIFFLTGWAPPPAGQKAPKAAERGSATVSFRELADATRKRAAAAAEAAAAEEGEEGKER